MTNAEIRKAAETATPQEIGEMLAQAIVDEGAHSLKVSRMVWLLVNKPDVGNMGAVEILRAMGLPRSKSWVSQRYTLYDKLAVEYDIPEDRLAAFDYSVLYEVASYVSRNEDANPNDILDMIEEQNLDRESLKEKLYAEAPGKNGGKGEPKATFRYGSDVEAIVSRIRDTVTGITNQRISTEGIFVAALQLFRERLEDDPLAALNYMDVLAQPMTKKEIAEAKRAERAAKKEARKAKAIKKLVKLAKEDTGVPF
jgi:hypothetical protein